MRADVFNQGKTPSTEKGRVPRERGLPGSVFPATAGLIKARLSAVYEETLVASRVLLRETIFVCAPDSIQSVPVERTDSLVRDDLVRRVLSPALGYGIFTSCGERKQRRVAVPVFRHDGIASSVLIGASVRSPIGRSSPRLGSIAA